MTDDPEAIARDIELISSMNSVPVLLQLLCQSTGMGFAAVARVTDGTWVACAVQDDIGFGLAPGGHLPVESTLCRESRAVRQPIVIEDVASDPVYHNHHTPRLYGLRSYISVPIVRSDGGYFGNLCAIDPRPAKLAESQAMSMFVAYAKLIGNQLEHEDQRMRSAAALEEERHRGNLLEEFVAVVGHDLRNPLQSIKACATLLAQSRSSTDPAVLGQRIGASVRRMSKLIDDVLDFARTRFGVAFPVELAVAPGLADALGGVVEELQLAHPTRTIVADIDVPKPVVCDRARVEQLLSNLLGNALQHGATDTPILATARLANENLVLSVRNAGSPIPPEHLEKIFEPYWRPKTSRPGGGLGLGLHICSQIVAAHGGSLTVASSEKDGTEFVATIPHRESRTT